MTHVPEWMQENYSRLVAAYKQNKLPHALLLVGDAGDGAEDFCHSLAARLMCEEADNQACGRCKSCLLMHSKNHPDFLHIAPEGKSDTIKIDVIRQLSAVFSGTAQLSGNKVVWLQNVETMNSNAANALLKLLEEPTENSYLILSTAQLGRLLPTIRSRCQIHRLTLPSTAQARQYLVDKNVTDVDIVLSLANNQPLRAEGISQDEIKAWFDREQQFVTITDFSQLAREINKQDLSTLLRQLLLWVDHSVKVQKSTVAANPAVGSGVVALLSRMPVVSLFQFRDYIITMIQAVERRANLNAQMIGEQIAARWQHLRRSL